MKNFVRYVICLIALSFLTNLSAQVVITYNTASLNNITVTCDPFNNSAYNNCTGNIGFNWTDAGPVGSTVANITVRFQIGVECGSGVHSTNLNGAAAPNTPFLNNWCQCSNANNALTTLSFVPAVYNVGGGNTFTVNVGASGCFGFIRNTGALPANVFAQIVVTYATPPNDLCANATNIPITCGGTASVNGTTITATPEAPAPPGCITSYDNSNGVWYTVVGNGTQMTAATCGAASYDTKLHVYTGACGSFTCVTGDDDGCGIANRSTVSWFAAAGVTYRILVSAWSTNSGTFTLNLTSTDITAPTVTCPANITANTAPGICTANVTPANPTTSDVGCGVTRLTWVMTGATTGSSPGTGINNLGTQTFNRGVTTVTYTVADAANNTSTCAFTVTVNDNQNPTAVTCPSNTTVNNTPGTCGAVVTYTNPTFNDNCTLPSTSQTYNYTGGVQTFTVPAGITSITVKAWGAGGGGGGGDGQDGGIGGGGAYSTRVLSVTPGQVLDVYVGRGGIGGFGCASNAAGGSGGFGYGNGGNGGNSGPVGCSGAGGGGGGGSAVVFGGTALVVAAGGGGAGGAGNDVMGGFGGGGGVNGGNSTVAGGAFGGSGVINGQTGINHAGDGGGGGGGGGGLNGGNRGSTPGCDCSAAGGGGGNSLGTTINNGTSPTPGNSGDPLIAGLARGGTQGNDVGGNGTNGLVNISWNNTIILTSGMASGSTFPVGTTTNTYTATDANGNVANCSFTVTVNDNQVPTLACPANQTLVTAAGVCTATFTIPDPITDNCTGSTWSYTRTGATTGGASGIADGTGSGSLTFNRGVTTVTVSGVDASGNNAVNCVFTVTVNDNQVPTLACPANQTLVTAAGVCTATFTIPDPITDNCTGSTWSYTRTGATTGGVSGIADGTGSGSLTFNRGVTTVTVSGVDASGNNAVNCVFTVTVNDNQVPTLACPANQTLVTAAGVCTATFTIPDPITDNCTGATWSYSATGATVLSASGIADGTGSGSLTFNRGVTTVTVSGVDASGNNAVNCVFTVTVNDNQVPTLVCPANQTLVTAAGVCTATFTIPDPITDNCTGATWSYTRTGATTGGVSGIADGTGSGSLTFNRGVTTVTVSGVDASGNNAVNCVFTVTVNDNQVPTLACPANQTLVTAAGVCTATFTIPDPITDNCTGATWSYSATGATVLSASGIADGTGSGSLTFNRGVTTITVSGVDASGNNAVNCVFTVTVNDNQVPTFVCPANQTLVTAPGVCTATFTIPDPISDNCTGATWGYTLTGATTGTVMGIADGTNNTPTFNRGVTTVTLSGTDGTNSATGCSFTVTVNDNQVPTLSCPANQTLSTSPGLCTATFTIPDPITDNCTGATWSYSTTGVTTLSASGIADGTGSGSLIFNKGVTNVTVNGVDASGNNAVSCSFTITVNDNESPIITCPANQSFAVVPGTCGRTRTYALPTFSDNCPGVMMVQDSTDIYTSGDFFPVGVTTIHYIATDASGNTATCSFTITITDNQPPTIVCPSAQTLPLNTSCQATLPDYTSLALANDNCPGFTVTQSPLPGTLVSGVGTTVVTLTVTQASGTLNATCNFNVNRVDNTAPVITCPGTQTLALGASCTATLPDYTPGTAIDNCGSVTYIQSPAAGSTVSGVGTTAVMITATDASGNSTNCTFNVNRVDNIAPTITCPGTQTLNLNATCNATLPDYTGFAILGAANCGATVVTQSPLPGSAVSGTGATVVTLTATDGSGNTATCTFNVNRVDITAPTITCPSNITVSNTTGLCGAAVTYTAPVGADNCSGAIVTQLSGLVSGATFPVGTTTNVFSVTDGSGNTSTCSFTVTVTDTELPVISSGGGSITNVAIIGFNNNNNIQSFLTSNGFTATDFGFTIPSAAVLANYEAVILLRMPGNPTLSSWVTNGGLLVTEWDAADWAANTAGLLPVTISGGGFVSSSTPVTFSGSPLGVQLGTSLPNPYSSFDQTDFFRNFTSIGGGAEVVATRPPSIPAIVAGSSGSGYTFLVGYDWADSFSPFPSFTGTLLLNILNSDVLSAGGCPIDITVNNDVNACGATVNYSAPVGTDNCAGVTTVQTAGLASGSLFPIGNTTNIFTVTDASGNTTTCSFTVTVVDNEDPVPTIASLPTVTGQCSATVTAPTATDNCSGIITATTSDPTTYNTQGTFTITWVYTDASANTSSQTQTVIVDDTNPPVFTSCSNIVVSNTPGACGRSVNYTMPATDNCSSVTITQIDGTGFTSGNFFPIGTTVQTYVATDAGGNSDTCSFTVTVNDMELPVITGCPSNITLSNTPGQCNRIVSWVAPTASDNCPGVVFTSNFAPGSTFNVGPTTVIYTATDAHSNITTCSFVVTINDTEAPVAICQPVTVILDASGNGSTTAAAVNNGSTDNCGIGSMSLSPSAFTCANVGPNTVTLTVTDVNGNTSTCTTTVTVQDTIDPVANCQPYTLVLDGSGNGTITASNVNNASSDACGIATMTVSPSAFTCANVGPNTVTLTVTDVNGNTSTCTTTVTVQDTIDPVANCQPYTLVLDGSGNGTITASNVNNASSDACGIATMTVSPSVFTCANVGPNTVTLTVTDVNGNTATCSSIVIVADSTAPVVSCQPYTLILDGTGNGTITAANVHNASSDACGIATMNVSPSAFNCTNVGANTVTLIVTDVNGNTATCTATVTVVDNAGPIISCNAPITVSNDPGICGAAVSYTVTSSDNCTSTLMQTSGLPSGSIFPVGTTTNSFTVTDASGNTATCSFTVTVNDMEAPVPTVASLPNATGVCSVTVLAPTATDNCSGMITATPASATYSSGGTYTQVWTYTDGSGNVTTQLQTIIVASPEADITGNGNPIIHSSSAYSLTNHTDFGNVPECSGTMSRTYTITNNGIGTLNLTGSPLVKVTGLNPGDFIVTSMPATSIPQGGSTTFTVEFNPSAPGFRYARLTVNNDDCNESGYYFQIRGNGSGSDITAPVPTIASLPNITGSCNATVSTIPTANDACVGLVNGATFSPLTYTTPGTYTIVWSYNDGNGNTSTQTQTVIVQDLIAPTALCQSASLQLDPTGNVTLNASLINNGSFDGCGPLSFIGIYGAVKVTNGAFTTNLSGWSVANGTVFQGSGGNPGGFAWLNGSGGATDPSIQQTFTDLIPGETYIIRGDFKSVTGTGSFPGQVAFGIDLDGTQIATKGLPSPITAWTPFSVVFTATSTMHTVKFRGEINGTDGDIALDNIRVDGSAKKYNCFTRGLNNVTLIVVDVYGNTATCNTTVNILSTLNPCPNSLEITDGVDASGENNTNTEEGSQTTSIEDVNTIGGRIYPNPSNGVFNLELNVLPRGNAEIKVVDALGQVLYVSKITAQNTFYDFSYLRAATYYIQVITDEGSFTKPIIITHGY